EGLELRSHADYESALAVGTLLNPARHSRQDEALSVARSLDVVHAVRLEHPRHSAPHELLPERMECPKSFVHEIEGTSVLAASLETLPERHPNPHHVGSNAAHQRPTDALPRTRPNP